MQILFSMFLILVGLVMTSHADESIVARVNGVSITSRQLETEISSLIPQATYHRNVTDEKREEFRAKALENLLNREMIDQDAIAMKIKPDSQDVKNQMKQVRGRFKSKKEYEAALKQDGISEDALQGLIEKTLRIQGAIKKVVIDPTRMSEAALKEYYEKNRTKYIQPASFRLRLISTKDERRATEALDMIRSGDNFGDIAASYSEDSYRIMGGDIGYIHSGRVLPEIEAAVQRLKPGQLSGIIKATNMFFIVKLEDQRAERQLEYDEVKDTMKKDLEQSRSRETMDAWLLRLKSASKIEIVSIATGSTTKNFSSSTTPTQSTAR